MRSSILVREILHNLERGVIITVAGFRRGSFHQKSNWANKALRELDAYYRTPKVRQTFTRLCLQRDVERIWNDNKVTIRLTEKGKKKLLAYTLHGMRLKAPRVWDNIWRIVVFDVPEKYKTARDVLRRFHLFKMGFIQIQDSVFVTPYSCRDEIDFIAEFYGIRPYIRIIEATSFDGEEELKKHFKV